MFPVLAAIGIGSTELLVILAIILLLFGPKRLPELAEGLGKSIRKFKDASHAASREVRREVDDLKQAQQDETRDNSKPQGPAQP